ncbi:hypothetical protein BEH94_03990 [Candidatus Altiarchaeales archaeon WOR_SM1_SCG]|nr:hypothetical protein BEH94_03990 [Candidatus Altiarchaeales archaeon WOR_SM1_SCG]
MKTPTKNKMKKTNETGIILYGLKNIVYISLIVSLVLGISGVVGACNNTANYTIHEWGVWQQEYNSNSTYIGTHPKIIAIIGKPVIYFHSNESFNVDVDIIFNYSNVTNIITIPNASVSYNKISWEGIHIENSSIIEYDNTYIDPDDSNVYPPQGYYHIHLPIDGDTVTRMGRRTFKYKYLFYEGDVVKPLGVEAYIFDNKTTATFYIKNLANYTIYDIFFVYIRYMLHTSDYGCIWCSGWYGTSYIYIPQLNTYENMTVVGDLTSDKSIESSITQKVRDELINQGLTPDEANELVDYWKPRWFDKYGTSFVLYTMPQEIYDNELPVAMCPEPQDTTRVGMFYVTDIPVKNPPTCDKEQLCAIRKSLIVIFDTIDGLIATFGYLLTILVVIGIIYIVYNFRKRKNSIKKRIEVKEVDEEKEKSDWKSLFFGAVGFAISFALIFVFGDIWIVISPAIALSTVFTLGLRDIKKLLLLLFLGSIGVFGGLMAGFVTANKPLLIEIGLFTSQLAGSPVFNFIGFATVNAIVGAVVGAIVGASLGLMFKDKKKILYLSFAGASGFGIGSAIISVMSHLFFKDAESLIIPFWGAIGGAALGLTFAYLMKEEKQQSTIKTKDKESKFNLNIPLCATIGFIVGFLCTILFITPPGSDILSTPAIFLSLLGGIGGAAIGATLAYLTKDEEKNNKSNLIKNTETEKKDEKTNKAGHTLHGLKNISHALLIFGLTFGMCGCVDAYSVDGENCMCENCTDCTDALNDSDCNVVKLGRDIVYEETCIDSPENFNNKIFDCQGHEIDGSKILYKGYKGIYLDGKENNMIKNCIITDCWSGIYLKDSSNNSIINNSVNSSIFGIRLSSSSNNKIIQNSVNSNEYGFHLDSSPKNTLINNRANSNTKEGIHLILSPKNILKNNIANSNNFGIRLSSSPHTLITNNIANSNTHGISLYSSSDILITNNIANSNSDSGIGLAYSNNNVANNNIANNNSYGLCLSGNSDFNQILNNQILNNDLIGIKISKCNHFGSSCPGGNTNNTLQENNISNNNIGIYSENSNSIINSNIVCNSINLDFNTSDWQPSYGDNNTCDNADGWNDDRGIGCRYACDGSINFCTCKNCSDCENKLNNTSCTMIYLTANIMNHDGTCIDNPENFNDKVFDCKGHTMTGVGKNSGVQLDGKSNNTIKSCILNNFSSGIFLWDSPGNSIINNTLNSNWFGIRAWKSSDNLLIGNEIDGNVNIDVKPTLTFIEPTPENGSVVDTSHINICISSDEPSIHNIFLELNGTNKTTHVVHEEVVIEGLKDGTYTYKAYAYMCDKIVGVTEERVVIINDTTPPKIVKLYTREWCLAIDFYTDEESNYTLSYVTNDNLFGDTITDSSRNMYHYIQLPYAPNGTVYYYKIRYCDVDGKCDSTTINNITVKHRKGYCSAGLAVIGAKIPQSGISLDSSHNTLINNTIHGTCTGISVDGGFNTLKYNNITNNYDTGIYLLDVNNTLISNLICENEIDIKKEYPYNPKYRGSSSGSNNTCDKSINWSDIEKTGCTYNCTHIKTKPSAENLPAAENETPDIPTETPPENKFSRSLIIAAVIIISILCLLFLLVRSKLK